MTSSPERQARANNVLLDGRLMAYRRGGIARYIAGLARWLPLAAPDLSFRLLANHAIPLETMPQVRAYTPPHHRLERWTLGFEVTVRRPGLIHSPDFVAPLVRGVGRVVTIHDLAFLEYPEMLSAEARRYYDQVQQVTKYVDQVIAVSDATRQQVIQRLDLPPNQVMTIYNGVDEQFFLPIPAPVSETLRQDLGQENAAQLLTKRPVILMVGTIEPRKRHPLLADAIEYLATKHPSIAPLMVAVGEPGWRCGSIVERIADLESRGLCVWIRRAGDATLRALYHHAALLAMPSLDEGFGLPACESMAAGLPVIVSARGALPEVVGDAGVVVADDAPEAWAAAIERLLQDNDLRLSLAEGGRRRAKSFTWEATARQTARVYREVLGMT